MKSELRKKVEEFIGVEITDDQENLLEDILYVTDSSIKDLETKIGWFKILLSLRKIHNDCVTRIAYKEKLIWELKVLLKLAGKKGKAFYNLYDCIEGVREELDPVELNELYNAILKIEEK